MMYLIAIITNFSTAVFDVTTNFSGEIDANVAPIKTTIATILDVIRFVGMGIALIIIITIGIKIMIASPSERANIKQYAIRYKFSNEMPINFNRCFRYIDNNQELYRRSN